MFYVQEVLSKKGPLGRVWIAAHMERKLTKAQVIQTSIVESAELVKTPKEELALRLSGHLLLGLSRIYSRKVGYLLTDCSDALVKIKMAFRPGVVDMPMQMSMAKPDAITMPEFTEEDLLTEELMMPMLSEPESMGINLEITVSAQDITLDDHNLAFDEDLADASNVLLPTLDGDVDAPASPLPAVDFDPMTPVPEIEVLRQGDDANRLTTPMDDGMLAPLPDDMGDLGDDMNALPAMDGGLLDELPELPAVAEDAVDIDLPLESPITELATPNTSRTRLQEPSPSPQSLASPGIRVRRETARKRRAVDTGETELSGEVMRKQIANCDDLLQPRQQAPLTYDEAVVEGWKQELGPDEWLLSPDIGPDPMGFGPRLEKFLMKRFRQGLERAVARDQRLVAGLPEINPLAGAEEVEIGRADPVAAADDVPPPVDLEIDEELPAVEALEALEAPPQVEDVEPIEMPDLPIDEPLPLDDVPLPEDELAVDPNQFGVDGRPLSPANSLPNPSSQSQRMAHHSSWSHRTRKMLNFLDGAMVGKRELSFESICRGKSKRVVAGAFFETLVLQSRGVINVTQGVPFGDITVNKTDRFADMTDTPSSPGSIASGASSTPLSLFSFSSRRSNSSRKRPSSNAPSSPSRSESASPKRRRLQRAMSQNAPQNVSLQS